MKRAIAVAAALAAAALIGPTAAQSQINPGCVWSGGAWLCAGAYPPGTPEVDRIAGADRYATSVALCRSAHPDGTDTIYLANGNGVDAVAAGVTLPTGGCVLLVPTGDTLPTSVTAELGRHSGATVIGIGGPAAVSDAQLAAANTATG